MSYYNQNNFSSALGSPTNNVTFSSQTFSIAMNNTKEGFNNQPLILGVPGSTPTIRQSKYAYQVAT